MDTSDQLKTIEKLLKSRQTREARKLLDGLIETRTNNSDVWYWNGVCEKIDGDLEKAEIAFKKAIDISPNHYLSIYGLGLILESKGNLPNAIEAFKRVVEINPTFTFAQKKLTQYGIDVPHQMEGHSIEVLPEKKYTELASLLRNGKWKEADIETANILSAFVGQKEIGVEAITKIPRQDLLEIDHLWVELSKGRFGFSTQTKIYKGVGCLISAEDVNSTIFDWYIKRVGWHIMKSRGFKKVGSALVSKSQITHSLSAPIGHLPAIWILPNKNIFLAESNSENKGGCITILFYSLWFIILAGFLGIVGTLITQDATGAIIGTLIGILFGIQVPLGHFKVRKEMNMSITIHKKMLLLFSNFDK